MSGTQFKKCRPQELNQENLLICLKGIILSQSLKKFQQMDINIISLDYKCFSNHEQI
ncbi:hypothetical protein pb186bvf_001429 [Paramecium bursaria]